MEKPVKPHWLLLFVLVVAGYVIGYKLAQGWFSAEDQGASFFPPAGVTLGALVLTCRRQWPVVLAAAAASELALDLSAGTGLAATLGLVLANVAEPLVGALLLTSLVAAVDLRRTNHLAAFLVCGVLVAPIVGATIAATTFVTLLDGSGWGRFALEWWSGDGLGVLVVGSAIVALRPLPRLATRMALEAALVSGLAVLTTFLVFSLGHFELVYVPVALLIVVAFRVGTAGVAMTGAAVAFVAAGSAAEAKTFWSVLDVAPADRVLYLQLGLAVVISASLALAAEIAGRERIVHELARSEAERASALERAELYESERAARQRAELLERHAERLAVAATAKDVARATVDELRSFGVPASWVQLVRDDRLELLCADGIPVDLTERYRRHSLDATTAPGDAVRSAALVDLPTGAAIDQRYPGAAEERARLRVESLVSTPLRSAGGAVIGVLSVAARERHWLSPTRRQLVTSLARQSGLAIERALLQLKADEAATDTAFVARLGEVLERAIGFDDRSRALVQALADELRAAAAVHAAEDGRETLVAFWSSDEAPAVAVGDLARVAREALAVDGLATLERGGARAVAMPLRAHGRALGALTIAVARSDRRLTAVLAQRLATRAALALDNALLYEQERRVSHSLQLGLLGGHPSSPPPLEVASEYLPGSATLEVGGDWYDLFELPDGRVALLVGDVVGHGLDAAVAMGQLRGAVRALAPLGSPRQVLAWLDFFVETLPQAAMTTLAYAVLDPESGELVYACAGHPPPLVAMADGSSRLVWEGRSPPLGSSFVVDRVEAIYRLGAGDTIVLYTDGLVERRTQGIASGLDALVRSAKRPPGTGPRGAADHEEAEDTASAVIGRLLSHLIVDDTHEDDVCVLAVRLPTSARSFSFAFRAAPSEVTRMRIALERWLGRMGLATERRREVVLAVSEAAANAAEHAHGFDEESVVEVEAALTDERLTVWIRDSGRWRDAQPEPFRGRGRVIMETLMPGASFEPSIKGTVVRMSLPVGAQSRS